METGSPVHEDVFLSEVNGYQIARTAPISGRPSENMAKPPEEVLEMMDQIVEQPEVLRCSFRYGLSD
jgi:hypothetical protein